MPFPSSQRSRPSAPQAHKPGTMSNAIPATPGTKKQEGTILSSGGSTPCDDQYTVGTSKPQE